MIPEPLVLRHWRVRNRPDLAGATNQSKEDSYERKIEPNYCLAGDVIRLRICGGPDVTTLHNH